MAITYQEYIATSDQVANGFSFSFPYLSDNSGVALLDVYVQGVKLSPSVYTISSSTPKKIVILVTDVAEGNEVRIVRNSSTPSPLVDFVNGSILTESELDRAYLHNYYLSQEATEGAGGEQLTKKGTDHYDADGAKITDLGTPTAATDAVTKSYVDDQDFADRAYIDGLGLDHFDGSNLSANVDMNGNRLTNIGEALSPSDVSSRSYVSNAIDEATLGTGAAPGVSKHTGTGSQTDFTLTFAANHSNSSSYLVSIAGAVQDPDDYTIVGGTNDIRFTTPPTLAAEILVIERGYRSAFSEIPSDYDYGSIVGATDSSYDYGSVA
jgi:hypothetical protein